MRAESNNLDILRAIAVLMVFLAHALGFNVRGFHHLTVGRVGVLLFFVHTSFVLMQSLERQTEGSTQGVWYRFMIRRSFRIFPLSLLACSIYILAKIPSINGYKNFELAPLSGLQILANFSLLQNLIDAPSRPIVLWSLPYEMDMYLLLPLIFLAIVKKNTVTLGLLGSVIAVFFPYGSCFLAGCLAYAVYRIVPKRLPWFAWPVGIVLCVSLYSLLLDNAPMFESAVCAIIALLFVNCAEVPPGIFPRCAAWIAKYSYGIYLFHMLFLWIFYVPLNLGPTIGSVAAIVCTLVLSRLLYACVEQPMIRVGNLVANSLFANSLPGNSLQRLWSR